MNKYLLVPWLIARRDQHSLVYRATLHSIDLSIYLYYYELGLRWSDLLGHYCTLTFKMTSTATESEVTIQLNERQIYDLEWLEDCYKKVRFPNPKCEDFLTEINKTLSNKIRGDFFNNYNMYRFFS